jgi:hypothetical protein
MFLRWPSNKAAFAYPVPPAPPTAVLVPWFRSTGRVRIFPRGWDAETAAFAPAALAGSWPQIEDLLGEKIASLTHAVIVLATSPDELLTEARRDRVWQAFRVPIFEQLVNRNGTLLAAECEAHDGFHIESPALVFDKNYIDPEPCGCGRPTPRLKMAGERLHSVAAYAR